MYSFVFLLYPIASLSNINDSPLTYFWIYSTASGNCLVTFSSFLVNNFILESFLWIISLNPSYLYSIAHGFPTALNPSSMFFTFCASIAFIGFPTSRPILSNSLIFAFFEIKNTFAKSLEWSIAS